MYMTKNTFVVGFMLFAIFFGAGNLIFPPKLGFESGADFWTATIGFIITGVGLPLLGIIVSASYKGGYKEALHRIHPWFSILFLVAIYLTIGPFFAIPRTAATAYEMAVLPFLGEQTTVSLLIFTAVYFALTIWLSLNPSKMVERIGSILTPALLIAILALVISGIALFSDNPSSSNVMEAPMVNGILAGYNTMDALASVAFSVIVINAIKSKGLSETKALSKQTAMAGVIAAILLALIYLSIGWIGNKLPISAEVLADLTAKKQDLGTYILNVAATQAFGELGRTLLGVIVSLACLTTAIGLVVSVSEYFHEIFPKISYRTYAIVCTLIGFGLANQGLSAVISKSIPVLLVLYPIAMSIIFLLLLNLFVKLPLLALRVSLILVTIVSILSVAGVSITENLPLKAYSMEWLPFAVGGLLIGVVFSRLVRAQ
ncbi:branched-chain amino acid permease [Actinobacillus pleuropneumoniae serovar 3 str. JL03]|uniref:Branched-chain amino acid transport system carrier protein n=5 Tax=Actinobacillus pleuropneumoniae TaxID=715 RepID=A3N3S9_ACTP2|nr:Branched-chain amino acid transport system carrier protein braB (Branched-chain amino acid uptake carrier braB) [Actinobacillus pleuropneumoniae serovar 5b str. L20]ABY70584.1 branched-chain amino acid permease [Actinobacillus pleuropneumoniae serovar 3 str. JL03]ACE62730.1 Branched-chain amino acid transport system carrier protein braB (Branched-chain amino acid uptake carrier braB) [Actinobacillus pleuropneumoniae serovar 7 str. AP76]ASU15866.1 Branched-chain amino acid transport system 2 c